MKRPLSPWSCLSVNFEAFELKVFCEGAPGDPAAKPNQRLSETFDHLDAQLHHREHQSYRRTGQTFSTLEKKTQSRVKSRDKKFREGGGAFLKPGAQILELEGAKLGPIWSQALSSPWLGQTLSRFLSNTFHNNLIFSFEKKTFLDLES